MNLLCDRCQQGRLALKPFPLVLCPLFWASIFALGLSVVSHVAAQRPVLPRATARARAQLAQLDALIQNRQWREAVDLIRSLAAAEPDALVESPSTGKMRELGFIHFQPMRDYLQRLVLRSSADNSGLVLELRRQVDATSRNLLRQGRERRDSRLLERIMREYAASSVAGEACWELSEHALQHGQLLLALECLQLCEPSAWLPSGQAAWRVLTMLDDDAFESAATALSSLPRTERAFPWVEPPKVDRAEIWARLALRAMIAGNRAEATVWEREVSHRAPQSRGLLWGEEQSWKTHLQRLLDESLHWPEERRIHWPTYAQSVARSSRVPPIEFSGRLLWQHAIPRLSAPHAVGSQATVPVADDWHRLRYCYPIGRRDAVWWADAAGWHAVGATSGRSLSVENTTDSSNVVWESPSREPVWLSRLGRYEGSPQFDLHAYEELVVGRDRALTLSDDEVRVRERDDAITVWDAERQLLQFQWPLDGGWFVSGPPIAARGMVFAMARSRNATQPAWRVMAWSLSTGRVAWECELGSARDSGSQLVFANDRLTMSEDRLFVLTHAGVVASIRAADGAILWLMEYPRTGPTPSRADAAVPRHWFRRGTPALVVDDTVFVLAADCNRVFALDAITGTVVWATAPGVARDARHLLGVVEGRLIASGDRLYWLDALSGTMVGAFPSGGGDGLRDALPAPRGIGRGLIAGHVVYWPTADRIWLIDARSGFASGDPIELHPWGMQGGNLLWHRGILVLADDDRIAAFAAPARPDR